MWRYLIVINILLIFFFTDIYSQKKEIARWGNPTGRTYIYTPSLGYVNIGEDFVSINGLNNYVKSSGSDTSSTKYNPIRYVVIVGVDSLPGLSAVFYDLEEATEYSYYHSLFHNNITGNIIYKKSSNGLFNTPLGFGTYGTYTSDGKRLYFPDGSRIILKQED